MRIITINLIILLSCAPAFADPVQTEWEMYGFTDFKLAEEWSSYGFTAEEADEWWNNGFDSMPGEAKKWKDIGITPKMAGKAVRLKLSIADLNMTSSKGKYKSSKNDDTVLFFAAILKANPEKKEPFIKFMKDDKKKFDCDQKDIPLLNPYEIRGKVFPLQAKLFQLLDKSKGLYTLLNNKFEAGNIFEEPEMGEGNHVFLDFGSDYAPTVDILAFAKGVDPLEYKAVLGINNIVHAFKVILFLKIPPELKDKMATLKMSP